MKIPKKYKKRLKEDGILEDDTVKIAVAILTCEAHRNRNDFILKWLPDTLPKNVEIFFIYGGSEKTTIEGNNIHFNCSESYEFFTEKVYSCIKHFYHQDIDYLVKLDNDIHILNFNKFIKSVRNLKSEQIDCAFNILLHAKRDNYKRFLRENFAYKKEIPKEYRGKYKGVLPDKWFGGHCYILNKKAMKVLLDRFNSTLEYLKPITEVCEDVLISHVLFSEDSIKSKQIERQNVWHKSCPCKEDWCILKKL